MEQWNLGDQVRENGLNLSGRSEGCLGKLFAAARNSISKLAASTAGLHPILADFLRPT